MPIRRKGKTVKINFSKKLMNLDGTIGEENPTLATVSIKALIEHLEGDERATGEDKFKRAVLAQKLLPEGEIELPVEDIARIKERVGRAYQPMIVFAAWSALEVASV